MDHNFIVNICFADDELSLECDDVQMQEHFLILVSDGEIDGYASKDIHSFHVRANEPNEGEESPPWE